MEHCICAIKKGNASANIRYLFLFAKYFIKARTSNKSICKNRAGKWNISYVQVSAVVIGWTINESPAFAKPTNVKPGQLTDILNFLD
jgi:hypothetical protein